MRRMLLVICLAAVPLGALAATSSATAQSAATAKAVEFDAMVVERVDLAHMSADDLSGVYAYRFRGKLWTRVEGHRNAVLMCGEQEVVSAAQAIAAKLDVPKATPED